MMRLNQAFPAQQPVQHSHIGTGNDEYCRFIDTIDKRFNEVIKDKPLFQTDAGDVFHNVYLPSFPAHRRQYHNCSACRHFINRFGTLAMVDTHGNMRSPFWGLAIAPPEYDSVVTAMALAVISAKIIGPFRAKQAAAGTREDGGWNHFYAHMPKHLVHAERNITAGQWMAARRESFRSVKQALHEFKLPTLAAALTIAKSDTLYRGEKIMGPLQWLYDLSNDSDGGRKANLVWQAVATAPEGFLHPRSSMVGTLLEDLSKGLSASDAAARFKAKMNPLTYMRPTAAPKAGNLDAAEKLVKDLGAESALDRRFAKFHEVKMVWLSKQTIPQTAEKSVFGHLRPRDAFRTGPKLDVPATVITFEKFANTVMRDATSMEVMLGLKANLTGFTTASDPSAYPIMKWDRSDARNPVSCYSYEGGSHVGSWGLMPNQWQPVMGISLKPHMWNEAYEFKDEPSGAVFILKDCMDIQLPHVCLFPEQLSAEFRPVRSTIEAYSATRKLGQIDGPGACGVDIGPNGPAVYVRVHGHTPLPLVYQIDRWN